MSHEAKDEDDLRQWEIEPHPYDSSYDILVTDSDETAAEAIKYAAEIYLWDGITEGETRTLKVTLNSIANSGSPSAPPSTSAAIRAAAEKGEPAHPLIVRDHYHVDTLGHIAKRRCSCSLNAPPHRFVCAVCVESERLATPAAPSPGEPRVGPRSNREPHAYQEHPLYPNYCAFAVGDEDYCKREVDAPIHAAALRTSVEGREAGEMSDADQITGQWAPRIDEMVSDLVPAEPPRETETASLREELSRWRGRWQSCLAHRGALVSYEYECPLCSLLTVLHAGYETSLTNARDESRPAAYRTMMEHFAEAGRQLIEYAERATVGTSDSGTESRGSDENRQPTAEK